MNYTQNYQLCLWDEDDRILMEDFNSDNEKLETALSQLPQKGNCQIVYGSYVGTGSGQSNALTFSGQPLLVLVTDTFEGTFLLMMRANQFGLYIPREAGGNKAVTLNWSTENTLIWHYGSSSEYQANISGRQYLYVALLAANM